MFNRGVVIYFLVFVSVFTTKLFAVQTISDSTSVKNREDSLGVLNFLNSSKKYSNEDFSQSLLYVNLAYNETKRIEKPLLRAFLLEKVGKVFKEYGYNFKAILSFNESLEVYGNSIQPLDRYKIYNELGDIFFEIQDYQKANIAYQSALDIVNKINNKKGIAVTLNKMGRLELALNKLDSAWFYFNAVEKISLEEEIYNILSVNYLNMAMLCEVQQKDKLLLQYLTKSYAIATQNNLEEILPEIANEFGEFYEANRDYKKAVNFYYQSYHNATKFNQSKNIKIASNGLAKCYNFLSEYKSSLIYSRVYFKLTDSLMNVEKIMQISLAEEKYKNEQTDKKIQNLTHEKDLAILKGKQNLKITWLLLGLLFLSTLLSGFIYNRNIYRRKINKELEEKIEERTKELKNINKYLENITYITTHDLKAPIVNLEGLVKLLKINQPMDEKAQKIIEHTEGTLHGMKKTVTDLAMMVANSKQEPAKDIHLMFDELLVKVSSSIQTQLHSSKTKIESDFKKYPSIVYPEKFLHSILLNLISNSVKYKSVDKDPHISMNTQNESDYCLLSYTDNGMGMDMEKYRSKIFSLYNRYHRHAEGQGIGLYLIKSQVEQMGGKIDIFSKPNEGTTFRIYLKEQS